MPPISLFSRIAFFLLVVALGSVLPERVQSSETLRLGAPFSDHMVVQADAPVRIWGWDAPGQAIAVQLAGHAAKTTADDQGYWQVAMPEIDDPGPYQLVVKGSIKIKLVDVVAGEVWWCSGQSNMVWPIDRSDGKDNALSMPPQPNVRFMKVPLTSADEPQNDVDAKWVVSKQATRGDFSAVAFFFGTELHRELDRPIGLIQSAWGGSKIRAWVPPEELAKNPQASLIDQQYEQDKADFQAALENWRRDGRQGKPPTMRGAGANQKPSGLAHAMFHPFESLSIRGVLWYQGESDAGTPKLYDDLFESLVSAWRNGFANPKLPVYFVQLPNFSAGGADWSAFRNQQRLTAERLPDVQMAVTIDVGKARDIHPPNKLAVGQRLAKLALAYTYGQVDPAAGSPRPVEASRNPEQFSGVRIKFDRVGSGLKTNDDGSPPLAFELVDDTGNRHQAVAKIVAADTVEVSHPAIAKPSRVLYAHQPNPQVNLINSSDLPVTPFAITIDDGK
ncbi:MAG: sialate O-acetylesterase [Planctomycetota bacterium]